MGIFISKPKSNSDDFEKILSDLDIKIQKAEIRLSEIKIRQRRTSFKWILYILIAWAACVVYLLQKLNSPFLVVHEYIFALLPVLLLPVGVYYTSKWMVHFYEVKQKQEESHLSVLCQEQKEKIEELKKRTSYYSTQSLIDRYDEQALKKKITDGDALRQRKSAITNSQQPEFPRQTLPSPPDAQPLKVHQAKPQIVKQASQPKQEPLWYDKLVDVIVGDAGPETKYALICSRCYAHNGLVLKEEYDIIQYVCPVCKQHNPSRQSSLTQSTVALNHQTKEEKKDETEKSK
ncbi:hypothetical protein BY458DRAFT_488406 [Sporodiniella umbellata]|nr:hypothetical protein BY458DRAFT_488406 [Sporodiniella umbellata]